MKVDYTKPIRSKDPESREYTLTCVSPKVFAGYFSKFHAHAVLLVESDKLCLPEVVYGNPDGYLYWGSEPRSRYDKIEQVENVPPPEEWSRVFVDGTGLRCSGVKHDTLSGARYSRPFPDNMVGYFEHTTRRFVNIGEEDKYGGGYNCYCL